MEAKLLNKDTEKLETNKNLAKTLLHCILNQIWLLAIKKTVAFQMFPDFFVDWQPLHLTMNTTPPSTFKMGV